MPTDRPELTLQTIVGPQAGTYVIRGDKGVTIGRATDCEVCLLNDSVSRRQVSVVWKNGQWFVLHHGTRGVSYLNGVRLDEAGGPRAIATGDVLGIGPWTFRVVIGAATVGGESTLAATIDDAASPAQRVERGQSGEFVSRADRRLRLLTECIARLHGTVDEVALAGTTLEAVLAGSGYARGAFLRPTSAGAGVEVVASRRLRADDTTAFGFSRSLIEKAGAGEVVVLTAGNARVSSMSIGAMGVHSALCAPVHLGASLVGFLYLDARGQESAVQSEAVGFCDAVARAYGLALADAKRAELERRQTLLSSELLAARAVQEMFVPPGHGDLGFLRYAVEMRPGLFVAGDLFDVIPLDADRVAVCLGDAAGHGAGSAMLMAMTQSFLHAELKRTGDAAEAVASVNRYITARSTGGRFVSLWVGIFGRSGGLSFVDAGHGHCLLKRAGDGARVCRSETGIPVGIDAEYRYVGEGLALSPGDRVVVYSDGLIEQRDAVDKEFGIEQLSRALGVSGSSRGDVAGVFGAMVAFVGVRALDDDATLASVEFVG